jgi:hypothetical protein
MTVRTGLTFQKLIVTTSLLTVAAAGAWWWNGQVSWSLSAGAIIMAGLAWTRRHVVQNRETTVNAARQAESDNER